METSNQGKLKFIGVSIIHVDFSTFQNTGEDSEDVNMDVDAKLIPVRKEEPGFRILMEVTVESKEFWRLKVVGIGVFELENQVSEDDRHLFINVNATAIMFPYLRSFITTFSSNTGGSIPSLVIPPQFFKGELKELQIPDEILPIESEFKV